ncbi:unnamed protein product [Durusdinium trenchii]|uniref:Methyltransferase FkbM domain-containing protein n=1 Tax=Durusdinium trenchii TaxID=1381693 RepID=A0ABP0K925_9DINO
MLECAFHNTLSWKQREAESAHLAHELVNSTASRFLLMGGRGEWLHEDEHGMFAQVQVASLPFWKNFEHLEVAPKRFWIEVGANNYNNIQHYPDFGDQDFVLSFEPLLDKYAELLTRSQPRIPGQRRKLGFQNDRGLVFPFAIGCGSPFATFTVTDHDSCSSILPTMDGDYEGSKHERDDDFDFKARCATGLETRRVPCISLEHVLEVWLPGQEIYILKVDAQGADLSVVQSAGKSLRQIQNVPCCSPCRPW